LVARAFVEGVVVVVVANADIDDDQWMELEVCAWTAQLRGLAWRVVGAGNSVVGGDITRTWGSITATPLYGHRANTHVDAFCQADGALGAQLVADVAAFIRTRAPTGTIIDAYAGSGAFGAALATLSSPVIAIEEAAVCAPSLQALPFVRAHIGRVHEVLPTIMEPIAAVVLDPPKKGAADAIAAVIALAAPVIALVACDPDAGARDARALCEGGYAIEQVVPYALFPGSIEVESLYLLSRLSRPAPSR
jgi:tRNA/tmRNA/rRNA uracil-C5-methylase (TrmA/RlmC/RlmD family)